MDVVTIYLPAHHTDHSGCRQFCAEVGRHTEESLFQQAVQRFGGLQLYFAEAEDGKNNTHILGGTQICR